MLKKSLQTVLGILLLAAVSLCFKPVRTWADEEGAYIYHWLYVNGPATIYTSNTWKDSGGTTHTGLEVNSGTYSTRTSVSLRFLGAMATSARPACTGAPNGTIGDVILDTTVNSLSFCNGSSWYKLVDSGSSYSTSGVYWTEY